MDKLLKDKKAIAVFVLPAFILFTLILFIPICQSIYYSFCDYDALTKPTFVGLKNYKNLLIDDTMKIAVKNSRSKKAKRKKYIKIKNGKTAKIIFGKKAVKGKYTFTVTSPKKGKFRKTTKTIKITVK